VRHGYTPVLNLPDWTRNEKRKVGRKGGGKTQKEGRKKEKEGRKKQNKNEGKE
jgi:hypothetical protein